MAAAWLASGIVCCGGLDHGVAVGAAKIRAATESRNHASDEWAKQRQTGADDGHVSFD